MKVQVLGDFIIECTWPNEEVGQVKTKDECLEHMWILYVDEASNLLNCGAGLILTNPEVIVAEFTL